MPNWTPIKNNNVRSIWNCEYSDCTRLEQAIVNPDFYQDSGTPVCPDCDSDMIYQYTEIMD